MKFYIGSGMKNCELVNFLDLEFLNKLLLDKLYELIPEIIAVNIETI